MSAQSVHFSYPVDGDDFSLAGEASVSAKRALRELGFSSELIRRVSIATYEGEINMVIHSSGGTVEMEVFEDKIIVTLTDHGKGIEDIELAMREGYSTASDNVRALGFGAGMGLPNMKRFSDEFFIESTVGEGTRIEMRFLAKEE